MKDCLLSSRTKRGIFPPKKERFLPSVEMTGAITGHDWNREFRSMGSIQPGIVHQIGIRGNSPHNSKPRYFEIIMGISIAFISAVAGNFTNSK